MRRTKFDAIYDALRHSAAVAQRQKFEAAAKNTLDLFALQFTIEAIPGSRDRFARYAFVTPMNNVPSVIVERHVVKPDQKTQFGMGFRDRRRDAFVFNVRTAFPSFLLALQQHTAPKAAQQLQLQQS